MAVVLPAPLGPRSAGTAARSAARDSPSRAVVVPYRLTSPSITTAGSDTRASLGTPPGRARRPAGGPRFVPVRYLGDNGVVKTIRKAARSPRPNQHADRRT